MRTLTERQPFESVDDRMIGMMRLILALSALLIIYIDPSEPDHNVALTYATLVLYSLYSAVLYLLSIHSSSLPPSRITHWVDVGCYLLLVALSSGTNSIFFFFFFFSILVASFRWGFMMGLRVTIVSTLLFTVIGFATAPAAPNFELNRFLLRPIYLLVLGYMMAYWGDAEIQLKRRLALLKEVNTLSNPRFGIDHTIGSIMRRVRAFYDADASLLITRDTQGDEFRLTRVERAHQGDAAQSEKVPPEVAQKLLVLPEHLALVYNGRRRIWSPHAAGCYIRDLAKEEHTWEGRAAGDALAVTLGADSFISVPLLYKGKALGRLYLTGRRGAFHTYEIDFLIQVIEQMMPVLENIRLLDRLASNAAEQERQRIARDLHDTVIQPYIGLQYKVAAIRNRLATGADVASDLDQLFEVTLSEITGLRRYVRGLKAAGGLQDDFLSAIRRYAAQFQDNYGITVEVDCKTESVNDRLAVEVIQFIHEALSNVRKHTEATSARVSLDARDNHFILRVENDGTPGDAAAVMPFTPRSITERAEALGGRAHVERKDGRTIVEVSVPL